MQEFTISNSENVIALPKGNVKHIGFTVVLIIDRAHNTLSKELKISGDDKILKLNPSGSICAFLEDHDHHNMIHAIEHIIKISVHCLEDKKRIPNSSSYSRIYLKPLIPHRRPNHQTRTDQHDVFNDVLALQGWGKGNLGESFMREKQNRRDRAQHLTP